MEKEIYFVVDSSVVGDYGERYIEFYESFEDAKQNAVEAAQDAPDYEFYIYKAQKIGTALVPLEAQYIPED